MSGLSYIAYRVAEIASYYSGMEGPDSPRDLLDGFGLFFYYRRRCHSDHARYAQIDAQGYGRQVRAGKWARHSSAATRCVVLAYFAFPVPIWHASIPALLLHYFLLMSSLTDRGRLRELVPAWKVYSPFGTRQCPPDLVSSQTMMSLTRFPGISLGHE